MDTYTYSYCFMGVMLMVRYAVVLRHVMLWYAEYLHDFT